MGISTTGSGNVSLARAATRAATRAVATRAAVVGTPWVTRLWSMLVLVMVIALSAPAGAAVAERATSVANDPFGASLLGMPAAGPVTFSSQALVTGLVDDRVSAALPDGHDLAATSAAPAHPTPATLRSATVLADPVPAPAGSAWRGSVTGAQLALGAPDVSGRGSGSNAVSSQRSGGSSSATIDGPATPSTRARFALTRLERPAAEMHPATRPLVRPG